MTAQWEGQAWGTAVALTKAEKRIRDLEADRAALLEALEKVQYWAGSHTIPKVPYEIPGGWKMVYDTVTEVLSRIRSEGAEVKTGE